MKDVREWDESDLDLVVRSGQKENTTIDYKASDALQFKDGRSARGYGTLGEKHRMDLAVDVASMANAEGGLIIYGIAERVSGYPARVDDGIALADVDADTIERVILSNINPRVEGFFIKPIELKSKGNGTFCYALSIPKAKMNGPHQSSDFLYHKRNLATTLRMSDNEIRDMVARSLEFGRKFGIAWDLHVELMRIVSAAQERSKVDRNNVRRSMLYISVSPSLRTSGVAIMELPKDLRQKAARLINELDKYNSIIEVADPGQRDEARLTEELRQLLRNIMGNGAGICDGLVEILKDEP